MRKKILFGMLLGSAVIFSSVQNDKFEVKVQAAVTESEMETQDELEVLDMSIISITTEDQEAVKSGDEFENAKITITNEDGETEMSDMDMTIRLRGNSSANAEKPSYKIKFDKKQNLLGTGDGKGKTWGLIANYYDHTLLRNRTMYQFADQLSGLAYTPNCQSVEVCVNGEYQGVYLLTELVNVNENRVNITEEVDEVEENGYLIQMSRYAETSKFDIDTASYEIKSDLSEDDSIKEQQVDYISNYISDCMDALKAGDKEEVEQLVDLDSLVDFYIVNEISKNIDVGWDSSYLYKDAGEKLSFGPVWDYDLALGNINEVAGFESWKGFSPYDILNVSANSNPWFCYAMQQQWFRELVQERWTEIQDTIDSIPELVTSEAQENNASYLRNFERWDILGKAVYNQPDEIVSMTTYEEHYTYLANWLKNRTEWLTDYIKSDDFINGILVDYQGEEFSIDSNLFSMSSSMAFAIPSAEMTMEKTDNIGYAMNIQSGGTSAGQIMVLLSGFMLDEGTEYELSFDYSSSNDGTAAVFVQENHDNYASHLSESINMKAEVQHYSQTFTVSKLDSNAAFTFVFGGSTFDNSSVLIDNLKLVKKTDSGLKAELTVANDWTSGAICNITVTNESGKDLTDGWIVDFDLPREIKNLWNAELVSSEENHYTISNPSWKTTLADGESYTFGISVGEGDSFELSNVVIK